MDEPTGARHPNGDPRQTPLIRVEKLSKSYAGHSQRIQVLNRLDFDVLPAETIAVLGPSGIGKSTFLHVLGTIDRPDSGTLLFRNQNVFQWNDEQLAGFRNAHMGFVFQFHHLLPEFSAIENAMMPLLIRGRPKAEAAESAEELLARIGLKDRLHHRVNQLSGGEQQRVALARALVTRPELLLADEPTGNLDKKNSRRVHELLCELNRELRIALIVVTHNQELAEHMSRRVTLADGRIKEMGEA